MNFIHVDYIYICIFLASDPQVRSLVFGVRVHIRRNERNVRNFLTTHRRDSLEKRIVNFLEFPFESATLFFFEIKKTQIFVLLVALIGDGSEKM